MLVSSRGVDVCTYLYFCTYYVDYQCKVRTKIAFRLVLSAFLPLPKHSTLSLFCTSSLEPLVLIA